MSTRRRFDAVPDAIDLRDRYYQPTLAALPDLLVNCDLVPEILDQGREGACTGFALAAVINFLLAQQGRRYGVSPRMLYEMARKYDEWPGEDYEGSSARGAMKGWVRHGVCWRQDWPDDAHGIEHFGPDLAKKALEVPGGAYYRVRQKQVRDVHSALRETGIVYATLMVHDGWLDPGRSGAGKSRCEAVVKYERGGKAKILKLPVILRTGRAQSGHAVALVGYTHEGFLIQNSWGPTWGRGGFALLPYEDFLLHAIDVWVAQLGVPMSMDLWEAGGADTTAGIHRAAASIPLAAIRPFIINIENNGRLSSSGYYWTTEADLRRLFEETIPQRTRSWSRRRVMLYLHGGLNSESTAAKRVVAMREVFLSNEIYPVHLLWETGFMKTSWEAFFSDLVEKANERATGSYFDMAREMLDWILERSVHRAGRALWNEMKENARLASSRADGTGAMEIVGRLVGAAREKLRQEGGPEWELHIAAHSAGSILAAHALPILTSLGMPIRSIQFLAPAISTGLFKERMLPEIQAQRIPLPSLYLLTDELERDDAVGPYGKSLLYLVARVFEEQPDTPLLGLVSCLEKDQELKTLFSGQVDGRPALVLAQDGASGAAEGSRCSARTHGGFDNDPDTMNSVLTRILNAPPRRAFTRRDLSY